MRKRDLILKSSFGKKKTPMLFFISDSIEISRKKPGKVQGWNTRERFPEPFVLKYHMRIVNCGENPSFICFRNDEMEGKSGDNYWGNETNKSLPKDSDFPRESNRRNSCPVPIFS